MKHAHWRQFREAIHRSSGCAILKISNRSRGYATAPLGWRFRIWSVNGMQDNLCAFIFRGCERTAYSINFYKSRSMCHNQVMAQPVKLTWLCKSFVAWIAVHSESLLSQSESFTAIFFLLLLEQGIEDKWMLQSLVLQASFTAVHRSGKYGFSLTSEEIARIVLSLKDTW